MRPCNAECDFVPVRDINTQSTVSDTQTDPQLHTCTMKMSDMQLEPGQGSEVPQETDIRKDCSVETDVKVKTVQYLLEELKALIAGQGKTCLFCPVHTERVE